MAQGARPTTDGVMTRDAQADVPAPPWGNKSMSEIAIFVESITAAGWLFLCALAVLAVGFLAFDRKRRTKTEADDAAQPGDRHAA